MEDRETPRIHKYGETKNDSNYDGNCTLRDFQFGTYNISGRLIFVEQRVHKQWRDSYIPKEKQYTKQYKNTEYTKKGQQTYKRRKQTWKI
jgi:hypothetical protein